MQGIKGMSHFLIFTLVFGFVGVHAMEQAETLSKDEATMLADLKTIKQTTIKKFRDKKQRTLLHHAAEHGYPVVIDRLLDLGIDINAKDEVQETALFYAARNGHYEVVKLLLKRGANYFMMNKDGKLVFDIVDAILKTAVIEDRRTIYEKIKARVDVVNQLAKEAEKAPIRDGSSLSARKEAITRSVEARSMIHPVMNPHKQFEEMKRIPLEKKYHLFKEAGIETNDSPVIDTKNNSNFFDNYLEPEDIKAVREEIKQLSPEQKRPVVIIRRVDNSVSEDRKKAAIESIEIDLEQRKPFFDNLARDEEDFSKKIGELYNGLMSRFTQDVNGLHGQLGLTEPNVNHGRSMLGADLTKLLIVMLCNPHDTTVFNLLLKLSLKELASLKEELKVWQPSIRATYQQTVDDINRLFDAEIKAREEFNPMAQSMMPVERKISQDQDSKEIGNRREISFQETLEEILELDRAIRLAVMKTKLDAGGVNVELNVDPAVVVMNALMNSTEDFESKFQEILKAFSNDDAHKRLEEIKDKAQQFKPHSNEVIDYNDAIRALAPHIARLRLKAPSIYYEAAEQVEMELEQKRRDKKTLLPAKNVSVEEKTESLPAKVEEVIILQEEPTTSEIDISSLFDSCFNAATDEEKKACKEKLDEAQKLQKHDFAETLKEKYESLIRDLGVEEEIAEDNEDARQLKILRNLYPLVFTPILDEIYSPQEEKYAQVRADIVAASKSEDNEQNEQDVEDKTEKANESQPETKPVDPQDMQQLIVAASLGNLEELQSLITSLQVNVNTPRTKNMLGDRLLHCAIFSKNVAMVKWLIEQGADVNLPNNAPTPQKPLELAFSLLREQKLQAYADIINILLAHGASLDFNDLEIRSVFTEAGFGELLPVIVHEQEPVVTSKKLVIVPPVVQAPTIIEVPIGDITAVLKAVRTGENLAEEIALFESARKPRDGYDLDDMPYDLLKWISFFNTLENYQAPYLKDMLGGRISNLIRTKYLSMVSMWELEHIEVELATLESLLTDGNEEHVRRALNNITNQELIAIQQHSENANAPRFKALVAKMMVRALGDLLKLKEYSLQNLNQLEVFAQGDDEERKAISEELKKCIPVQLYRLHKSAQRCLENSFIEQLVIEELVARGLPLPVVQEQSPSLGTKFLALMGLTPVKGFASMNNPRNPVNNNPQAPDGNVAVNIPQVNNPLPPVAHVARRGGFGALIQNRWARVGFPAALATAMIASLAYYYYAMPTDTVQRTFGGETIYEISELLHNGDYQQLYDRIVEHQGYKEWASSLIHVVSQLVAADTFKLLQERADVKDSWKAMVWGEEVYRTEIDKNLACLAEIRRVLSTRMEQQALIPEEMAIPAAV